MPNDYINMDSVMERDSISNKFMELYGDDIFLLHTKCDKDEKTKGYSYKQYNILSYHIAFEYCIRILFVVLSNIEDKTDEEEELEVEFKIKEKYNFYTIESNLAHIGIQLDKLYKSIKTEYLDIITERNE